MLYWVRVCIVMVYYTLSLVNYFQDEKNLLSYAILSLYKVKLQEKNVGDLKKKFFFNLA